MRKKFKTSVQLIWILHHPPSWFPCIVQTRSTPPLRRVCQDRRRRSESGCWPRWGRSARSGAPSAAWSRPRVTEDLPPRLPWCWPRESPWEFSWGSWCLAVEWINRMKTILRVERNRNFSDLSSKARIELYKNKNKIEWLKNPAQKDDIKNYFFYRHLLNICIKCSSVWRKELKFRGFDLN